MASALSLSLPCSSWSRSSEGEPTERSQFHDKTGGKPRPCQGWGRGFESLRPLQISPKNQVHTGTTRKGCLWALSLVITWSSRRSEFGPAHGQRLAAVGGAYTDFPVVI